MKWELLVAVPLLLITGCEVVHIESAGRLPLIERNPDGHIGELISCEGRAASISESNGQTAFQVLDLNLNNPSSHSFVVFFPGSLNNIQDGTLVSFLGTVAGQNVGTNAFGGPVYSIAVNAIAVEGGGYILHFRVGHPACGVWRVAPRRLFAPVAFRDH
jgi:hypothetical protein